MSNNKLENKVFLLSMKSEIVKIDIEQLLELKNTIPLADVRTPAEFNHAHISGAFNLPIFSDEERAAVGTTYKQKSREAAILLGLDFTGPKWSGFIKTALKHCPEKKIILHCWRGGMRSGTMAWILNLYGFDVYVLEGGYKNYRNHILSVFSRKYNLVILGGMTGSKKTRVLKNLSDAGEQIIDLENLAQHQGSAFGSLGYLIQPSQEQFENLLSENLILFPANEKRIWVEDESITIGKMVIPQGFWQQMRKAIVYKIEVETEERIDFLVEEYGNLNKDFLKESIHRITKKLGPQHAKAAIEAVEENRMREFIKIVLVYYDKAYLQGQNSRDSQNMITVPFIDKNNELNIKNLINTANQ